MLVVPKCHIAGCNNDAQNQSKRKDGSIVRRKLNGQYICGTHWVKHCAAKRGVSVSEMKKQNKAKAKARGFVGGYSSEKQAKAYTEKMKKECAKLEEQVGRKVDFEKFVHYHSTDTPYLVFRENHCENSLDESELRETLKDENGKRLFPQCNYPISHPAQLEVDHIDGNHAHNHPDNLQTLCGNCHTVKTFTSGDNLSPGRKTRKEEKSFLKRCA